MSTTAYHTQCAADLARPRRDPYYWHGGGYWLWLWSYNYSKWAKTPYN